MYQILELTINLTNNLIFYDRGWCINKSERPCPQGYTLRLRPDRQAERIPRLERFRSAECRFAEGVEATVGATLRVTKPIDTGYRRDSSTEDPAIVCYLPKTFKGAGSLINAHPPTPSLFRRGGSSTGEGTTFGNDKPAGFLCV